MSLRDAGFVGVTKMVGDHRFLLACALTVFCCTSCQSASPAFVLTDPIDGGPVPVSCTGVDVKICEVATSATLDYLTPDYAGVEAVRVEPLADPPAGAVFAVRVTLDHKMFLNSGLQPYRVVQTVAGESIQVAEIRD